MAPWIEKNRLANEKKKKKSSNVSKLSDKELMKKFKTVRQQIGWKRAKTEAEKEKKRKIEDLDATYYDEWKRRDVIKKASVRALKKKKK